MTQLNSGATTAPRTGLNRRPSVYKTGVIFDESKNITRLYLLAGMTVCRRYAAGASFSFPSDLGIDLCCSIKENELQP